MSTIEKLYDKQRKLPVSALYKQFSYDPLAGELRLNPKSPEDFKGGNKKLKAQQWNDRFANHIIISGDKEYARTNINGVFYPAHQIAWAMYYGEWAFSPLDHIDGDGSNNRICNLRKADASVNSKNRKLNINNSSGVSGLQVHEGKSKLYFSVTVREQDSEVVHQTFDDFFEAVCFRKAFEKDNGYTLRHGTVRKEEQSVLDFLVNLDYSEFEIEQLDEGEPNFKFEYAFESKTERTSFYRTISHIID